jgi:tetratricopeptide (TPR) repeat protein
LRRTTLIGFILLAFFFVRSTASFAQTSPSRRAGHTIVILPFENTSKAPGIDWIGEAFAEILGQRMAAAQLFVIRREDRIYAFDRLGIPANVRPSRATLYRVADEMDVDYLVTGSYTFDGRTFTTRSQVTDMKRLRMSPDAIESGALTQLTDIQNATAWDLLRDIDPGFLSSKSDFLSSTSSVQIRLDALENYIRGLLATVKDDKVKHFKEAVRLNPTYTQAILHLGRTYFDAKEYDQASLWFGKIGKTEPAASEANFYIGLSSYYTGNFQRAEEAFDFVASRVPLIEVFNNLGVVTARRGKKSSLEYFERVVQADSRDPDYRFNLALALERSGDTNGALRQIKESLSLKPQDTEAKSLLETLTASGTQPKAAAGQKLPLERIKRNYDETSYRQLALEIQNVNEERYAKLPRAEHAAIHVKHSSELISQGLLDQAEDELREAILLDVSNSGAHAGLAAVLEQRNELSEARFEATAANRLKASPEAFLTLARIDMKQSKLESARENVDRALKIDSASAAGVELKRAIAEQLAQKPKTEGTQ